MKKINKDLIEFLSSPKIKIWINEGDFTSVYNQAKISTYGNESISKLTEVFLQAGINPLDYLQVVPTMYLVYSKAISGVKIPDHITTIENSSFRSSHIIGVDIPVSVTHIGFAAFWDCDKLTYVGYSGTKEQWHKLVPDRATCFDMDRNIIVTCSDGQIVMRDDGSLDE